MARYLLPENGLTNWDGNTLQGNFYSFQVGTVLFVNLLRQRCDLADVGLQLAQGDPVHRRSEGRPGNMNLVPDHGNGTPNLQLEWLEKTLSEARRPGSGVEMIVVQFHFPFASVDTGNSCDMGLRAAFGPLFDKYEVDITLAGHNHNYCRSCRSAGTTRRPGSPPVPSPTRSAPMRHGRDDRHPPSDSAPDRADLVQR